MLGYTTTRRNRPLKGKGGYGCFFLFALIFLIAGSIPSLLNLSGLRARFTGVETTALVRAVESCGNGEDDGNYYSYTFNDRNGKQYQITNTSVCSSGIVSDGDQVNIWYQPSDPAQFVTGNDLVFDALFFVGFSIPLVIWAIMFIVFLSRLLLFRRSSPLMPSNFM